MATLCPGGRLEVKKLKNPGLKRVWALGSGGLFEEDSLGLFFPEHRDEIFGVELQALQAVTRPDSNTQFFAGCHKIDTLRFLVAVVRRPL